MNRVVPAALVLALVLPTPHRAAAQLVSGTLASDLVSSPVEYYALLPPGYDSSTAYPLLLALHGGGGSRNRLAEQQALIENLWSSGDIPPMVVVTPSAGRSLYMDYRDGSERWERFLIEEFLPHLRERFHLLDDRRHTLVAGTSMGGMGALRLAFKRPDLFGAVAALEPGIAPVLDWTDIRPKHRFWRSDRLFVQVYGIDGTVDRDYWNANNPATIVTRDADRLRDSGLRIFVDAGDQDMFWLYEGAEFLHRVLWDARIRHEYRLYYGADHVGASLAPRAKAMYRFLAATLTDPVPDRILTRTRRAVDRLKRRLDEADHYGIDRKLIRRRRRR